MIHILHGDNLDASYQKLIKLQSLYKDHDKVYINSANEESLYLNLFSKDMFKSKNMLICENLMSAKNIKKLPPQLFKDLAPGTVLVIWEKQEVANATLKKFSDFAQIENFKLPTNLFNFLDSISRDAKKTIFYLKEIEQEKVSAISWHLENRLLLLILSKLNFTQNEASHVSGRNLAPWQWEKIKRQSVSLSIETLKKMFTSTLRIETLIKSGKTQLTESVLLSQMFLKYLGNQNT
jgi:hypothetical protein